MADNGSTVFGWPDYLVFSLTLAISLVVGVYHAWKGAGSSTSNYLLGGKAMAVFPIAMSLAARYIITQSYYENFSIMLYNH